MREHEFTQMGENCQYRDGLCTWGVGPGWGPASLLREDWPVPRKKIMSSSPHLCFSHRTPPAGHGGAPECEFWWSLGEGGEQGLSDNSWPIFQSPDKARGPLFLAESILGKMLVSLCFVLLSRCDLEVLGALHHRSSFSLTSLFLSDFSPPLFPS